ncbi:MAG: sigma-70 family RNA polymerase sigma factor, partial [Acidimicrobiia bacterium]
QAYCARRTSPSQVADAVAEVFLVAWRRLDQMPEVDEALPWLYGTAYRVISHQWRSKTRTRRLVQRLLDVDVAETWTTEGIVIHRHEHDQVRLAASRLKPIDQEILRLTIWEELSHAEVGVVLSIDPGAVKQRAYRARQNLTTEYNKLTQERKPPAAQKGGVS